jgi:cbb3-type cytochrome oxidase maturation protein
MTALLVLIPVSLLLGLGGLAAFMWSVSDNQWDDPDGEAARILDDEFDTSPVKLGSVKLGSVKLKSVKSGEDLKRPPAG